MACFVDTNNKRQNLEEAATGSEPAPKRQKLELSDRGKDIAEGRTAWDEPATQPPIQEDEGNSLETFPPSDAEEEEQEKCACSSNWIDEKCIKCCISDWTPSEPVICYGCYYDEHFQKSKYCVLNRSYSYEVEEIVRESLLYEDFVKELFEYYLDKHYNADPALIKNFELGIRSLLNRQMDYLVDVLSRKDRSYSRSSIVL
jgi:hypothetical protein